MSFSGRDHRDLVSDRHHAPCPRRPLARQVEHDAGHIEAQDDDQVVEAVLGEVVGPLQRCWFCEQAEIVGASEQQAVDEIGVEPFRRLFADARSQGIPLILETPQLNMEIGDDDPAPDPYDVQMMALLDSFTSR